MADIETDYLVVGAGATGMAFVDTLVAHDPEAEVVVVDRRHAAGGHWVDAYPFVRLHQPSAFYGVETVPLGNDAIDTDGINAGFYERASAAELRRYYELVMTKLEATGRVRFMLNTSYAGPSGADHVVASQLSGRTTAIRPRRRLVDASYVESKIPARSNPPYEIADGVRHVTPNHLIDLDEPADGFTVIGGGKTSMDVCYWLLDQGVDPGSIRWIRPRDGWFVDRTYTQPLDLVHASLANMSRTVETAAHATSGLDYAKRMEAHGMMCRLDENVDGEIYRGATVARAELERLREIDDVVRLGRVKGIGRNGIELDDGPLTTTTGTVHVDCTAQGLATAVPRPMFTDGELIMQFTTLGVAPWSAATVGFVETLDVDDDERNRLCPVVPRTGLIADQLRIMHAGFMADGVRREHPVIGAWNAGLRLNPGRAAADHPDDPRILESFTRMFEFFEPAMANLERHAASATPDQTTQGAAS